MGSPLILSAYKKQLSDELSNILNYWSTYTVDNTNGGFFGKINNQNEVDQHAPKGSVLNARILWTFAAACNLRQNQAYLNIAHRAYRYIVTHFIDAEFGGTYWSVDYKGEKLDTKKQVYGIAFTIYGLSEYYRASGIADAKEMAVKLYHVLVARSYDVANTGYFEAFSADWQPMADLRLSDKDANEKKTMNTHLHVLEAYANLYKIWPDEGLKTQIVTLLHNFTDHFINKQTWQLLLFFDEHWHSKSNLISYGHDIEASWLLLEAAEVIDDVQLVQTFKYIAIKMAGKVTNGLDADGALFYEFEPDENLLVKEKHWWVQAEAMVGFYNAWQICGDDSYLQTALKNWQFINNKILDLKDGEWFWGIKADGSVMNEEDKVGLWKCPYHNSRACIEIIRRIGDN